MSLFRSGVFYPLDKKHNEKKSSEPKIILLSFLWVLIPSAILLTLPVFSVSGLSFADALFTATSDDSVCGTSVSIRCAPELVPTGVGER